METFLTQLIQEGVQSEYWYTVVFLGTFLLGENMILATSIVAATQPYIFPSTFAIELLATLSADIFWYLMAVHVVAKTRFNNLFEKINAYTEKTPWHIASSPVLLLLIIKFLVGVRILLLVSIVLKTKLSFIEFLFLNTLGVILFVTVINGIGWLIGSGIHPSAYHIFTAIVLSIITLSLLLHLLSWTIFKRQKNTREEQ